MTEAGWFDDYEDPARLRWYDGTAWTEHVAPKTAEAAAASTAEPATVTAASTEPLPDGSSDAAGSSRLRQLASLGFLGAFLGLLLGGCLFNAAGAITPLTEEAAVLDDIDIEFSTSSGSSNRRTHYLSGVTESGIAWRIANQDAYEIVKSEGWPQQVQVAIGDWTGTAERVTGRSFVVDHQTTGLRIWWTSALVAIGVAGLVASVLIGRRSSGGVVGALIFAVGLFVVGNWLGYQGVQWVQSG